MDPSLTIGQPAARKSRQKRTSSNANTTTPRRPPSRTPKKAKTSQPANGAPETPQPAALALKFDPLESNVPMDEDDVLPVIVQTTCSTPAAKRRSHQRATASPTIGRVRSGPTPKQVATGGPVLSTPYRRIKIEESAEYGQCSSISRSGGLRRSARVASRYASSDYLLPSSPVAGPSC